MQDLSTLDNKIFIQGNQVGLASYHFETGQPYISYKNCPWNLDDGNKPPEKKYFENWSYDANTRTFKGQIKWEPVTFSGNNKWDYVMIFDEGFTYICAGTVDTFYPDGASEQFMFNDVLNYKVHVEIMLLRQFSTGLQLLKELTRYGQRRLKIEFLLYFNTYI